MASQLLSTAPPVATAEAGSAASGTRAIFTLSAPIRVVQDGVEVDLDGFDMRQLDVPDLPLLDQFQGQPIALAQHVVAALCDLTVDQVRQLCLADFTMLASDALWQVTQLCADMGLPDNVFFFRPIAEEPA